MLGVIVKRLSKEIVDSSDFKMSSRAQRKENKAWLEGRFNLRKKFPGKTPHDPKSMPTPLIYLGLLSIRAWF